MKNLPDKFLVEGAVNKSIRNIIMREMVSNTLMHREFTSSYTAKFVIEKDRMYVENANRSAKGGNITLDNLEPNSKNPLIASFFRNIGYADQLGSGVRKLFEYSKYYSGKDPVFIENDIFQIIVPLNDDFSFDYPVDYAKVKNNKGDNGFNSADKRPDSADKRSESAGNIGISADNTLENADKIQIELHTFSESQNLTAQQERILYYVKKLGQITSRETEELLGVKQRRARNILREMVEQGILKRKGAYRNTTYVLNECFG